jgi:hypothetical protein
MSDRSFNSSRKFWVGTEKGLRLLLQKKPRGGQGKQSDGPDLAHIRNFAASVGAEPTTTEGPYSRLLPGFVYVDANLRLTAAKPGPKDRDATGRRGRRSAAAQEHPAIKQGRENARQYTTAAQVREPVPHGRRAR